VITAPSSKQLPEFLKAHQPDIIAENSDESVVIEIKSREKASEEKDWGELARVIQQHPGWRLQLVMGADQDRASREVIARPEIEARLREGLQLANAGSLDAGLLITWSATEAAMRRVCKKQKVDLPDYRPATLVTRLYTDGLIEREEYDLLMRDMHLRDAVAHGLRQGGVDAEAIEQLRQLTLRLLRSA
jgi:hypothetical protein